MSRRTERLARARKQRQKRSLMALGGAAGALVLLLAIIALASQRPSRPALSEADLPRISPQETHQLMQAGEATLLDVRLPDAYQALHAEGALSFPESQAVQLLPTLPPDGLLVFV